MCSVPNLRHDVLVVKSYIGTDTISIQVTKKKTSYTIKTDNIIL